MIPCSAVAKVISFAMHSDFKDLCPSSVKWFMSIQGSNNVIGMNRNIHYHTISKVKIN